jgi:uncharacterized membrane protein HdeD (DUF308 family)
MANAANPTGRENSVYFDPRGPSGWIITLGIVFLVIGVLAVGNVMVATIASVLMVGLLMLAGGILQVVHGFQARSWPGAVFWTISGLLYGAAGVYVLIQPERAAIPVTLVFLIMLALSGASRVWLSLKTRFLSGWVWALFSGLISIFAAVVIGTGLPQDAFWVLGLWLAVDLLFQGGALVAFGFALRSVSKA